MVKPSPSLPLPRLPLLSTTLSWLLLVCLLVPGADAAQAEVRLQVDHPLSLRSEQLTPEFWIQRVDDADAVRLAPAEIERLNQSLRVRDPSIHQLDTFKHAVPISEVKSRILKLSVPLTAQRYLANGQAIAESLPAQLAASLALDQLVEPHMPRFGLVVQRSSLRTYPTRMPLYKQPGESDLDRLQESALFPGDPVVILHQSADQQWLFVISERYAAWIESVAVAIGPRDSVLAYARQTPALTVIDAKAHTVSSPHAGALSELRLEMGVRIPWLPQWPLDQAVNGQLPLAHWVVELPQRQPDGSLRLANALIARSEPLAEAPLAYTSANVVRQAFRFLGERYGWGHDFNARDCSGFVSEVYRSMGILLPRNTGDQAASPVFDGVDLRDAGKSDRELALASLEVGDLIHIPGHVMMFIGLIDDQIWLIHDAHSLSVRDARGEVAVVLANGVVVTPLHALLASDGTPLADHITRIQRIRPVPAAAANSQREPRS
ncbi:MAG: C40 family peptidase [Pseudomarimonas sp.]